MKKTLLAIALAFAFVAPSAHAQVATTTPAMSGHRAPHVAGLTTSSVGWYISNVFPDFGRLVFINEQPKETFNWQVYFAQMNYK